MEKDRPGSIPAPQGHALSPGELLELKRWNTPTIYNGWEQITRHDAGHEGFNLEPCQDFMPEMGTMVGYAITVVIEPGNPEHSPNNPNAWTAYRRYVASLPGPKIVVVQDLDKPKTFGAFWGEVNSNVHRALGCVGTITDGSIRDFDEMRNAGFKALARRFSVGHAFSTPVRWNCEVEVFGCRVRPGQLVHADKHGFLVIPNEDEPRLLEAVRFMDGNECRHLIGTARNHAGKPLSRIIEELEQAGQAFGAAARVHFGRNGGEW